MSSLRMQSLTAIAIFLFIAQYATSASLETVETKVPRVCWTRNCWNPCWKKTCPRLEHTEHHENLVCVPDCDTCQPMFYYKKLFHIPLEWCYGCPETFVKAEECVRCIKTCPGPVETDPPQQKCIKYGCLKCVCPPGYLLDRSGKCIPAEKCPDLRG